LVQERQLSLRGGNVETPPDSGARFVVVANPATRGQADKLIEIVKQAAPPGAKLDVHLTEQNLSLRDVLDLDGEKITAVIAIGGDGTVRSVATAIGDRQIPIGIIPGGSTNIVAQEHGIPADPVKAAALIFGPHSKVNMDAGVCGERRFLHMAGAGFDSQFFAATDQELKRRVGWRAYLRPAFKNLSIAPADFSIQADDTCIEVRSQMVLIANGTSILKPFFPVYSDIRSDDGWFDVLIFTPKGRAAVVRTALSFATRRLHRSPYVTRIRAKHVEVHSDPPIPLQLDGDIRGETPATFDIIPNALTLIVPNREPVVPTARL
jgi:diacylglycerol kinase (ATP)